MIWKSARGFTSLFMRGISKLSGIAARKLNFCWQFIMLRSISLCLGRPPSLTDMPYPPSTLCMLYHMRNYLIFVNGRLQLTCQTIETSGSHPKYWRVIRFTQWQNVIAHWHLYTSAIWDRSIFSPNWSCTSANSLFQIINESYNTVYSGTTRNINPSVILKLENKMVAFHEQLPAALRIEDAANLQTCVPPHILCLKWVINVVWN
jgi:hypothetical protein